MSNTLSFAQRELDILIKSSTDPENRPIIENFIPEILALCEKFGTSGQSGGSAPYTAYAISKAVEKLCLQEPICPITGIDEEWTDVTNMNDGEPMWQNKRCSALFKDKNGEAKYIDAIVFDGVIGGHTQLKILNNWKKFMNIIKRLQLQEKLL